MVSGRVRSYEVKPLLLIGIGQWKAAIIRMERGFFTAMNEDKHLIDNLVICAKRLLVGVTMNKKGLVHRVTAIFVSFSVYLPVLAGILYVMWYVVPLWYLSWYIVVFIFPIRYWDGHWNPVVDSATGTVNWSLGISIWVLESLVLVLGIVLFLYGLKTMVTNRVKGDVLVTTNPYRWVRHPQHLGIILFLLALSLFLFSPWSPRMIYVRPSDILSWSLIAFGLTVGADLEEVSLSKKFGEKYDEYRSRVSFMIPYFPSLPNILATGVLGQGKPARYVLWFAIYWTIMCFILFLFSFVQINYWM